MDAISNASKIKSCAQQITEQFATGSSSEVFAKWKQTKSTSDFNAAVKLYCAQKSLTELIPTLPKISTPVNPIQGAKVQELIKGKENAKRQSELATRTAQTLDLKSVALEKLKSNIPQLPALPTLPTFPPRLPSGISLATAFFIRKKKELNKQKRATSKNSLLKAKTAFKYKITPVNSDQNNTPDTPSLPIL